MDAIAPVNNPMRVQVESYMGAVFIGLMAIFCTGLVFVALKNYNSDLIVLDASQAQVKTISNSERDLIEQWVKDNKIEIPEGKGYRYVIQKYPSKPWLTY